MTSDGASDRRREALRWISELFLDCEESDRGRAGIARILAGLGFSLTELDALYEDAAVVLYPNTYATAGAWAGFDQVWLVGEIDKRRASRGGLWWRVRRYLVTRSTIEEWRKVRALIERQEP